MRCCVNGHKYRNGQYEFARKVTHILPYIGIEHGKQGRKRRHQAAYHRAYRNAEANQAPYIPFGLRHAVGAQVLSDHNGNGVAHRQEKHVKQVIDRRGDVHRAQHVKPAQGISLDKRCHAYRPQELIDQKRRALAQNRL
ncbi:hypothetical protein SDC9_160530 [bioreactor metagenome]|uniref:Uncharacterized protein n=1 Tax=bioreactor metagenome TaxID=1076179 RepID=A0A645FGW4_9ZZZZ